MGRTPGRRLLSGSAIVSMIAAGLVSLAATPAAAADPLAATTCQEAASSEGMRVVQQVSLPTSTWNGTYSINDTASLGAFDRLGYCLELTAGGNQNFVYTSMQPYTQDVSRIGIPKLKDDIRRQRVSDLTVVSNVASAPVGAGQTGFLEMWNLNYESVAAGQVPGASATRYDAEDRPMNNGNHGSFQIHRIGEGMTSSVAPTTVLAVNGWNSGTIAVGIGAPSGSTEPDWTFANNAGQYQSRVLTVYARDALVALTEQPENMRLYPRGADGYGQVVAAGTATAGVDGIELVLTRDDGVQTAAAATIGEDGAFSVAVPIAAELHTSSAELRVTSGGTTRVSGSWEGLVAGDVVVIQGQSNAEAIARLSTDNAANAFTSEFVRSFGSPDQDPVISGGEHAWNYAQAWMGSSTGSRWNSGHVGLWGLRAAAQTVAETGVPIALINGARGGQQIGYYPRNDANPNDLSNNYGRLRARMESAGLLGHVSALFYYQGESDHDRAAEHLAGFGGLLQDWTEDFAAGGNPANIKYYAFQVRNSCAVQTTGITLREAQRTLAETFPGYDLETLSTTGIPEHDGCHYPYQNGYEVIADYASGVLLRDFYAGDAAGLTAPNPTSIVGAAGDRLVEITLDNASDPIVVTGDPSADFVVEGSSARVTRVQSAGDGVLRLTLSAPLGDAPATLTYLAHNGTGPTIATERHVGLLSFHRLPIDLRPAPDASSQLSGLSLDGVSVAGFDPAVVSYDGPATGAAPVVVATPLDPAASVEYTASAARVRVKVTSADGASETVYTVWLATTPTCALPTPWQTGAWGAGDASEFCALGPDAFRIADRNAGVWTNSDAISTAYRPDALPVGGSFEVRLDAMSAAANPDTRAGIVVRNDLSPSGSSAASRGYAVLAVSSQNGTFLQWDANTNGRIDSETAKVGIKAPAYLRVTRPSAGTVEGFVRSSVFDAWTSVGSVTVGNADALLDVGAFANSNRAMSTFETGRFSGAAMGTIAEPVVGVGVPTITGDAEVGATLTAALADVEPSGAALEYRWLRGGAPIAGATGSTYEVTHADAGQAVSVEVRATAAGRSAGTAQSAPLTIAALNAVEVDWVHIDGSPYVGETLTASTATTPADASVAYEWFRGETSVGSGATYTVVASDLDAMLSVRVTASAAGHAGAVAVSRPVHITTAPAILVSAWSLDAANTTSQYQNEILGGRILTAQGSSVPGPRGNALQLGGSARGVIADPKLAGTLNGSAAVSVSAWIRPTALPASGESNWVFGSRINATGAGIDVNFVGKDLRVAGRSLATEGYQQRTFAYPDDGRWHHVAAILNYAENRIELYIDGVKKDPKGGSVNFARRVYTAGTPSQPDTVGGSPEWGRGMFTGGIDEVRVYGSALSASEVAALAVANSPAVQVVATQPAPASGWYDGAVDVRFVPAVLLPVGTATIEYRTGENAWQPLAETTGTAGPITVDHGTTVVEGRALVGGVAGPASTLTVRVDTQAPEVTIGEPVIDEEAGTATVALDGADADSGVAVVEYRIDGGAWQASDGPLVLGEAGDRVVEARVTDAAGNVSAVVSRTVTVPVPQHFAKPLVSAQVSNRTLELFASGDGVAIASMEYRLGDGPWTTYAGKVSLPGTAAVVVTYRATDARGKVSDEHSLTVAATQANTVDLIALGLAKTVLVGETISGYGVRVVDSVSGAPVAGVPVQLSVTGATFADGAATRTTSTNASGIAVVPSLSASAAGTVTIVATHGDQMVELAAVTVTAPSPSQSADVSVEPELVSGKWVLTVSATNTGSEPVSVKLATRFGSKTFATVGPGQSVSQAFKTYLTRIPGGTVTVTLTGPSGSVAVTEDYAAQG